MVTWGDADYGGDSSAVQGELKDQVVKQIYSTDGAFAALLGDGRSGDVGTSSKRRRHPPAGPGRTQDAWN